MTLSKFDIAAGIIILILLAISVYNHRKDGSPDAGKAEGLGVKELIEEVKSELVKSEQSRMAANQASLFELKDFDLEIKFVVNERRTESGKIEYQVVTVGGETTFSSERVQTIKLHMTAVPPKAGQGRAVSAPADDAEDGTVTHDPPSPSDKDEQK